MSKINYSAEEKLKILEACEKGLLKGSLHGR